MNFFDVLNNVLYNKKNDNKILYDGIEEFSPFMINRWCSMHSPHMCNLVNVTTNKLHNIFDDKLLQYKMFINMIPRQDRRRIKYIKKTKQVDSSSEEETELIDALSRELEISKKEINMYIQYEREHRPTSTD